MNAQGATAKNGGFRPGQCGTISDGGPGIRTAAVLRGSLSYALRGGGGEHLSCDHVALPAVFLGLSGAWLLCRPGPPGAVKRPSRFP